MVAPRTLDVDPAHREQLAAWDGDEGAYWAANADRFDRALARYQERFMTAARIAPDARVLDIGCGTGGCTLDAARSAREGSALGVDLSSAMLRVAREIAEREGIANVAFEQVDAQVHPFADAAFDVVIGRTSAMFFADMTAAFTNLARALQPTGRLALLVWQSAADNEWFLEISTALAAGRERPVPPPDAPQPFSMSDPDRVRSWLVGSGFGDVEIEGMAEPMWFGDDTDDALRFVLGQVGWMLDGLDHAGRARAVDDLRTRIARYHGPDGVTFGSACWSVAARRVSG